jgi:hypothetical protein
MITAVSDYEFGHQMHKNSTLAQKTSYKRQKTPVNIDVSRGLFVETAGIETTPAGQPNHS